MAPAPSPLKARRLEQGLRLVDVADRAKCSVSLVCMVEGGYQAGRGTRERIAAAVGASLGSFWPQEPAR